MGVPQSQITIGVPAYARAEDNTIPSLLLLPFRGQKDYWRHEDGTLSLRVTDTDATAQNHLME